MKDKNNLEPSDYKTGVSTTLNGLEVNAEIGLCTKDMAKENPIKDFEILIEEHKDKWSKQMYDYFKECLNEIKKEHKALEIIKEHTLYCENVDCFVFVNITKEVNELLKEVLL